MKDIFEEAIDLFDDFERDDELVQENHKFIEKFNKKGHYKLKKPFGSGIKAS